MQAFIWFLMHHLSQVHWKVHRANLAREGGAFAAAFHFHGFSWPPWSWWCVMSWDPLPVALSFFLRCYLSVRWPIRPDPLVLRTLILWIIGCGGWKSKGLPRRSFSCGCKGMEKKKGKVLRLVWEQWELVTISNYFSLERNKLKCSRHSIFLRSCGYQSHWTPCSDWQDQCVVA